MVLTKSLIDSVYTVASKFGNGKGLRYPQGEDMAQECLMKLFQEPESNRSRVLLIAKHKCLDILDAERASIRTWESSSKDDFTESISSDMVMDIEKYIEDIPNPRLRAIVDRHADRPKDRGNEKRMSRKDRMYLLRHRDVLQELLDRDVNRYLKPVSPWMLFISRCEPFLKRQSQGGRAREQRRIERWNGLNKLLITNSLKGHLVKKVLQEEKIPEGKQR